MRALSVLVKQNIQEGDRQIHFFSGNTVEDLAFRTASMFLKSTPVTVNWYWITPKFMYHLFSLFVSLFRRQADTEENVLYKIRSTNAKIVLIDDRTNFVDSIRVNFPEVKIIYANSIYETEPINSSELILLCRKEHNHEDTRFIIFTSGTTGHPKGVELTYSNYSCNRKHLKIFKFGSFIEIICFSSCKSSPSYQQYKYNRLGAKTSTVTNTPSRKIFDSLLVNIIFCHRITLSSTTRTSTQPT